MVTQADKDSQAERRTWCESIAAHTLDIYKNDAVGLPNWVYPTWLSGSDSLVDTWCGSTCAEVGVGSCSQCVDMDVGL